MILPVEFHVKSVYHFTSLSLKYYESPNVFLGPMYTGEISEKKRSGFL